MGYFLIAVVIFSGLEAYVGLSNENILRMHLLLRFQSGKKKFLEKSYFGFEQSKRRKIGIMLFLKMLRPIKYMGTNKRPKYKDWSGCYDN